MVCGQAKVSDLHMILRVKEDVDRLQVPVYHALKEREGWIKRPEIMASIYVIAIKVRKNSQ